MDMIDEHEDTVLQLKHHEDTIVASVTFSGGQYNYLFGIGLVRLQVATGVNQTNIANHKGWTWCIAMTPRFLRNHFIFTECKR